jgi:hypothetical protein
MPNHIDDRQNQCRGSDGQNEEVERWLEANVVRQSLRKFFSHSGLLVVEGVFY